MCKTVCFEPKCVSCRAALGIECMVFRVKNRFLRKDRFAVPPPLISDGLELWHNPLYQNTEEALS